MCTAVLIYDTEGVETIFQGSKFPEEELAVVSMHFPLALQKNLQAKIEVQSHELYVVNSSKVWNAPLEKSFQFSLKLNNLD